MSTWLGKVSNFLPQSSSPSQPSTRQDSRREKKTVLMTLGGCTFTSANGRYKCPCEVASYISSTGAIDMNALCADCLHSLSVHSDYARPHLSTALGRGLASAESSPCKQHSASQSLYPTEHPDLCPRHQTVETLARLLDENMVMHVRGTPASGKSTLARLLYQFLSGTQEVILMDAWDNKMSATEYLAKECRARGYIGVQASDILASNFVFIIDEAQQTYVNPHLWYSVIKFQSQRQAGPRFCLFSSYGSPTIGAPDYPEATTPPVLSLSQRVSLTVSRNSDAPDICLFYNLAEYKDVLDRFCKHPTIEFTLDRDVQDYLLSLTNGHPGAINSIMLYIRNFHRSHLKQHRILKITLKEIQDALDDNDKLFSFLEVHPAGRSLPSKTIQRGVIDPNVVSVLLSVLRDGSITFNNDDPGIQTCFRNGWVHTEVVEGGQVICIFPSALHARFVEHCYGRLNPVQFPFQKYPTLQDLCLAVIRGFSKLMLCRTRDGRRLGPSGQIRPPEAAFQDEFYRSYWIEIGPGVRICSEWTGTEQGRIDFIIVEPGWGIELLRDGNRLRDHYNRFRENGAYYPWIKRGLIKDWLLLDCRHSYPATTCPEEPRLWRVVFKNDYSLVHILDCENRDVVPEFRLANH